MIYTEQTKKAMNFAYEKHKNQYDKSGLPYIFHPFHLAEQMDDENSTIVALLHDTIEDTDTSVDELKELGFNSDIVEAINILTNRYDDYFEYLSTIPNNELAMKVKLADLKHNSDLSRIDNPTEKDYLRQKKYLEALEYLKKFQNTKKM